MEDFPIRRQTSNLTIQVKTPTSTLKPHQTPSLVKEISLKFRVQIKCCHLLVNHRNSLISSRRHKIRKLPFAIHQFPIHILEHANNEIVQLYLSRQFENYVNIIDVKSVAAAIKDKWIQIRKEGNYSNAFGRVFPLTITLKWWTVVTFRERQQPHLWATSEDGMVPTHDDAIETMLKRVKFEGIEGDQSCVICFEEIIGTETKNSIVEMPCFHVFHENCIKKWLKNSHYCPICRYQMPTN